MKAGWSKGLGERLRRQRLLTGLSKEEFGLQYSVTAQTVGRWESGGSPGGKLLPEVLAALQTQGKEVVVNDGKDSGIRVVRAGGGKICSGFRWTVVDRRRLVSNLALLAQGHHAPVRAILEATKESADPKPQETLIGAAIRKLTAPATDELCYHRDGWVFQLISWLAAHATCVPGSLLRAPQPRMADKGLDGLIVSLRGANSAIAGVTICEDKASESPRKTVTDKVWPAITLFETGARDDELQNETTALLDRLGLAEAIALAETIHWKNARRYRVSATGCQHDDSDVPARVFSGFETKAPGKLTRRQGEVLDLGQPVGDLREWMSQLCTEIIEELRATLTDGSAPTHV